jgi:hypothetical protein
MGYSEPLLPQDWLYAVSALTPTRGAAPGRAEPNPAGRWLYKDSLLAFAPVVDHHHSTDLPNYHSIPLCPLSELKKNHLRVCCIEICMERSQRRSLKLKGLTSIWTMAESE